jgi:competence ComEA-like helix-hairpin-helix protein
MQGIKAFNFNTCNLAVKLFPLLICFSLIVCCHTKETKQVLPTQNPANISEYAINLNTASARELEKIPHVGAKTAERIVEFRNKNGAFRKAEHLLLIDGISDARFREMKNFIKVE